jgi:hypothetical protein
MGFGYRFRNTRGGIAGSRVVRFHGFGGIDFATATDLASRLAPCVFSREWQCVFDALVNTAARTDEVGAMLQMFVDSTCAQALTTLGFNPDAATVVGAILSGQWNSFRSWAGTKLNEIRNERRVVEVIPDAQGGGWLVTYADGAQRKFCSAPFTDTAGNITGYSNMSIPADQSCSQFAVGPAGGGRFVSRRTTPDYRTLPSGGPKSSAVGTVAVVGGLGAAGLVAWLLLK